MDDAIPTDRHVDVHTEIATMARAMHGRSDNDVSPERIVQSITAAAVELLAPVDHAGITLVTKNHRSRPPELESTAETGLAPRQFDKLQHEVGDGPCFRAIWEHTTVRIDDVAEETRWPALMAAVLDQTPIRSSLSIQLFVTELELGALNLHSETSRAFDADTERIAGSLAAHAAIALNSARRGLQFQEALASRDIIGQAKGLVMERYDVDALQAFDILRRLSQDSNTALVDVAEQIVTADHPPPEPDRAVR